MNKWLQKNFLLIAISVIAVCLMLAISVLAQTPSNTGQITGVVKDPAQALVPGSLVTLTNQQTAVASMVFTDDQGAYRFPSVLPGTYVLKAEAKGFQTSVSSPLKVDAGQTVKSDLTLAIAETYRPWKLPRVPSKTPIAWTTWTPGGPLGTTPILDLPYSVNVISRQLIDDTQSRNFKEAAKYLPLVSFQEMQGPEVMRPETRGMQGSNMQNDRKDGMGIAVTTPSALEEYEQIEVVNGLGGASVWSRQSVGHVQLRHQASDRGTAG